MKLIIQIPCFNEALTLPATLRDLPDHIDGVETIEILVIDDGSTDGTAEVARQAGVHHILQLSQKPGLANAFRIGLDQAARLGADIVVNTDGDNQYQGSCIPALVKPIVEQHADFVIGAREFDRMDHFSWTKKQLQKFGSWVVGKLAHIPVRDATSGFRAFSRTAALRLQVFSGFTYTLETIFQAKHLNLKIVTIPITTNPPTRQSRLFRSVFTYVRKSMATIFRAIVLYEPFKVFLWCSGISFLGAMTIGLRFLYFYMTSVGETGRTQSLILAAILFTLSFSFFVLGIITDSAAVNRRLLHEILYHVKRISYRERNPSSEKRP